MYDLLLKGGRVIDPANGLDGTADVAFAAGKVAAVGGRLEGPARDERDVAGCIVVPGLIDLHTHVYWGGTSLGVDPEPIARRSGTTCFVDAGTAGPANFHGFRRHLVEATPVKVLPFLNVAFPGIFAFSAAVMVGECTDLRLLNARECVRVAREHADLVVGIKVRVGLVASGANGIAPLDIALEVADELGLPVMAHLDFGPPSREEVLARLRPGDILTHCFRPFPNAPSDGRGRVREQVLLARERGVVFDVGHGAGSFSFRTARAMLEAGFAPDCISSDVHVLSAEGLAPDVLHTMSKLLHLGMALPDVVRAATARPADVLRRPDLGRFSPGAAGDAAVLAVTEDSWEIRDSLGCTETARRRLAARGVVLNGRWWHG